MMSDNLKKEAETRSLLEEVEDLSIGSGAGTIVNPGSTIISSAMPPINYLTLKGRCNTVVTKGIVCKGKIFYWSII